MCLAGYAYLLVRSIAFVSTNRYPAGYFYDLGVNIIATAYQDTTIRSLGDVRDSIGWAPWGDHPQFLYNPMLTSAILVSIAKLLGHDAVRAVKIVMVGQFWCAALGMWYLYSFKRCAPVWAALAGLVYAFLPSSSLAIASNLDVGFCVALAPAALAASLRLTRAYGVAALPLAGAICGLAGSGFAIEYLFFVSLPAYAIVAAYSFRRDAVAAWLGYGTIGAIATATVIAYCIAATEAASAVVGTPFGRLAETQATNVLATFSQNLSSVVHFVVAESTLNPLPEFNVSSSLWQISIAGTLLWVVAIVSFRGLSTSRAVVRIAVVSLGILLVSFGPTLPFVASVWLVIARVPSLQLLRTPDRFVYVAYVVVIAAGIAGFEAFVGRRERQPVLSQLARVGAVAAIVLSFAAFDLATNGLIDRPTVAERFPALDEVNRSVSSDAPVLSYSFARDGSIFDTTLYGIGHENRAVSFDFVSRYANGSAGLSGLLAHAGIGNVIATPDWTYDGPSFLLDFSRDPGAVGTFRSALGPAAYALRDAIPRVSQTKVVCLHGGYGAFDLLTRIVSAREGAFVRDASACTEGAYADYDPRDALAPQNLLGRWSSADVDPSGSEIRDHDYAFVIGRTLVADERYRDSIDGSVPAFGARTRTLPQDWRMIRSVVSPSRGEYVVRMRIALHVRSCFVVAVDGAPGAPHCFAPGFGLRWFVIRVSVRRGGANTISIVRVRARHLDRIATDFDAALDGVTLARSTYDDERAPDRATVVLDRGWLFTGSRPRDVWLPNGTFHLWSLDRSRKYRPIRLRFDGSASSTGFVRFDRSGYHRIAVNRTLETLVLRGPTSHAGTDVRVLDHRSALQWTVSVARESTIRLAMLDDGNWVAESERRVVAGRACDLVDTCFDLSRGTYRIRHRLPNAILIGFAVTSSTWLFAIMLLLLRSKKQLRTVGARTRSA